MNNRWKTIVNKSFFLSCGVFFFSSFLVFPLLSCFGYLLFCTFLFFSVLFCSFLFFSSLFFVLFSILFSSFLRTLGSDNTRKIRLTAADGAVVAMPIRELCGCDKWRESIRFVVRQGPLTQLVVRIFMFSPASWKRWHYVSAKKQQSTTERRSDAAKWKEKKNPTILETRNIFFAVKHAVNHKRRAGLRWENRGKSSELLVSACVYLLAHFLLAVNLCWIPATCARHIRHGARGF